MNAVTKAVTVELDRAGIDYSLDWTGRHGKVRFVLDGKPRFIVCSRTPSDWRAPLQQRALVRRLLRTGSA